MPEKSITLLEVAALVSGELIRGNPEGYIDGVQTLAKASGLQATFLSNRKYKADLETTQAALVLLSEKDEVPEGSKFAVIKLANPYVGFALLQQYFHPLKTSSGTIHPSAVIHESVRIAENVQIDAHVCIDADVEIAANVVIGSGCVIGAGCVIGETSILHPRVVIEKGSILGKRVIIQSGTVIGSDGFGYAWSGSDFIKIPQVGNVILEDDVEIGANTCVDRGAIEDTIIRAGAKLDNLIQIAHNVDIGERSALAGQSGFAGSTVIGKGCQFGAQSGVAGHLKLVDGSIVGAKAGVIGDIKEPGMVSGFPAVPHRHWLKASALFDRLPVIWDKIKRLG